MFFLTILTAGTFTYLADSYSPGPEAIAKMDSSNEVQVVDSDNYIAFLPVGLKTSKGLIFYQGGKVEAEAYSPLMHQLAANGISSYLMEMPFNLAIFDIQAANEVITQENSIDNWYLAGHSLGGSMAASYTEENGDQLAGLILLASYSTVDLTEVHFPTLMIYGTADEVMNRENYEEIRSLVPTMEEVVLEGGNHAQFGDYGEQDGDGVATISANEQLNRTVEAIIDFIQK